MLKATDVFCCHLLMVRVAEVACPPCMLSCGKADFCVVSLSTCMGAGTARLVGPTSCICCKISFLGARKRVNWRMVSCPGMQPARLLTFLLCFVSPLKIASGKGLKAQGRSTFTQEQTPKRHEPCSHISGCLIPADAHTLVAERAPW